MQHQRYPCDADQHHRPRQKKGAAPTAVVQGQAQFQATKEQRKQHRNLCEVLHPPARLAQVQLKNTQPRCTQPDTQGKTHYRRGHRDPAQVGGSECEQQQDCAQHGEPDDEGHFRRRPGKVSEYFLTFRHATSFRCAWWVQPIPEVNVKKIFSAPLRSNCARDLAGRAAGELKVHLQGEAPGQ